MLVRIKVQKNTYTWSGI